MNTPRIVFALLTTALLMFAFAVPAASAQSIPGYSDEGPTVEDNIDSFAADPSEIDPIEVQDSVEGSPSASAEDPIESAGTGSLPFTGLDIGLIGIAGGVLLLFGLGMRRLTRSPDTL